MKTKQTKQTILASDEELKDLTDYHYGPAKDYLRILLQDRTTGGYIRFCTDNYQEYGYGPDDEMTPEVVLKLNIMPRVTKTKEQQKARSKAKAEVFTPSWICNTMNNHCDEVWFGYKNVFNIENDDHTWKRTGHIVFPEDKTWEEYVKLTKLEVTCGEAPFMCSRYDTTTGLVIPTEDRIGFLDRKMRIISENQRSDNEEDYGWGDWFEWAKKAFQASYGFEWSGDNLLLARINLFYSYIDYATRRNGEAFNPHLVSWKTVAETYREIAIIISWNLWQMDGLKDTLPHTDIPAKIMDWEKGEVIEFISIKNQ